MFYWITIQVMANPNNNGNWIARWRWDNYWTEGRTKWEAIHNLKVCSI